MREIETIQSLVGGITEEDLMHVDSYICRELGIFIPSVGFCGYAIQRDHTHPSYSFTILLNESKNVVNTDMKPDSEHYVAAILSPDTPHEETQGDSFVRYIALMAPTGLVEKVCGHYGIELSVASSWHSFLVPKGIMVLIDRFIEEYDENPSDESALEALAYLIIGDLMKSAYGSGHAARAVSGGIQGAIDYVHQNYAQSLSVGKLAEYVHMSVSAFSRKFTQQTGQSPATYILATRLKKAKKLLRQGGATITDIAQECGFSSAAHLTASFKKQWKITPSAYRSSYSNL